MKIELIAFLPVKSFGVCVQLRCRAFSALKFKRDTVVYFFLNFLVFTTFCTTPMILTVHTSIRPVRINMNIHKYILNSNITQKRHWSII